MEKKYANFEYTDFKGLDRFLVNIKKIFAPKSHNHKCSDISDFPSSLPASDVPSWAKSDSKPSYTWGELSGKTDDTN